VKELLRAAFVIARRDFSATVLSRTFLLFLLGPFFPVLMVAVFGAATAPMSASDRPTVGVIASSRDYQQLQAARDRLQDTFGALAMVNIQQVVPTGEPQQAGQVLASAKPGYVAVLEGGLANPRLVGSVTAQSGTAKQLRLMIAEARRATTGTGDAVNLPVMLTSPSPSAPNSGAQALTARGGQSLLFLLTLLLAGMLLSQLIEEKSNKVIEVLAAAVPIDSIFLGKLLAMLCASLVGIAVWAAVGAAAIAAFAPTGLSGLPPPAVGWPVFILLGVVYFAMSYLLLGAIFLGIGAHASSAREVQTLSMPVTMAQVVIFAFASVAVGAPHSHKAVAAGIFPLSSPYVMIARAAEVSDLMPHVVALVWQLLWVALFLRIASGVFRKSVLKSGPTRASRKKKLASA
jgi:ABC-2 type transport system permease protein